ncbi:uncharacterized protein TNCV_358771 [Trichonephila clavipes]|nr:uncharacterized protein TNCV_358771 [Trichonephila clavipes]
MPTCFTMVANLSLSNCRLPAFQRMAKIQNLQYGNPSGLSSPVANIWQPENRSSKKIGLKVDIVRFSPLTLLQHVEWFTPALTFFSMCSDFWLDFPPVVRMACEIKLLESEATTGFFVLLGEQGNKSVLGWVMKEGLIPSRYECQKCKKDMLLVERKGTIDGFEWRCRVQLKENPHFVCRSLIKGMWFSHSRLSICVILRLTRGRQQSVLIQLQPAKDKGVRLPMHCVVLQGLLASDLVILNHGQVIRMKPELAPSKLPRHTNKGMFEP